jgi:hypothetical protein
LLASIHTALPLSLAAAHSRQFLSPLPRPSPPELLLGKKKPRTKALTVKHRLARFHWDNCKSDSMRAVAFTFAAAALTSCFLKADVIAAYAALCTKIMLVPPIAKPFGTTDLR